MGQPSEAGASLGCEWILRGSQGGREPGRDKPLAHGLRAGQRLRGRAQESEDSKWVQEARGSLTHSSGQPKGHRLQRGLSHNLKHPGGGGRRKGWVLRDVVEKGSLLTAPGKGQVGTARGQASHIPRLVRLGLVTRGQRRGPCRWPRRMMTQGREQWSGKLRGVAKAGNPSSPTPQPPQEQGSGQRSGGVT